MPWTIIEGAASAAAFAEALLAQPRRAFGSPASWAIPLAAMLMLGFEMRRTWLGIWNAMGALDLVVAVSLGLLSAPSTPIRVFTEGPGTQAMTTLPWTFIPAMLVPIFLLVHFAIATKLRTAVQASRLAVA